MHNARPYLAFFGFLAFVTGCGGDDDTSGIEVGGSGRSSSGGGTGIDIGQGGKSAGSGGGTSFGGGDSCGPNLTGLVRDFRAVGEKGGHPDFEAYAGTRATTDIVEEMLGTDKKPVYNGTGRISSSEGQQTTSKERYDEWYRNTDGVNEAIEFTLTLSPLAGGVSSYENREFFPIDGKGFGNYQPFDNGVHNFHFTFELHTEFKYNGGETFRFLGDDDLWVFINGRRAINLGGLHAELNDQVSLDDIAGDFGLEQGNTYPLDLFHAERHTQFSRFRVDTSIEFTNCQPIIIPR